MSIRAGHNMARPEWLERAGSPDAGCAARLSWIDVPPITSAGRVAEIRKCRAIRRVVYIDAVSETAIDGRVVTREWSGENTADHQSKCDVRDVIKYSASIRKACGVAAEQAQSAGRCIWRATNSGV
jgi:hypothetical protein